MNLYKTTRIGGCLFQLVPQRAGYSATDARLPACGAGTPEQCAFLPTFVGGVLVAEGYCDCNRVATSCLPEDCAGLDATWRPVAEALGGETTQTEAAGWIITKIHGPRKQGGERR